MIQSKEDNSHSKEDVALQGIVNCFHSSNYIRNKPTMFDSHNCAICPGASPPTDSLNRRLGAK